MPAGINTSIGVHYGVFAIIKLFGYSIFASHLNKHYGANENIWKVGAFRMFLGMLIGAPYGYFFSGTLFFLAGLVILRIFEWGFTIFIFYDRKLRDKRKMAINIGKGIVVSFILDVPAIFGFMLTGGLWIC